jgi:mono/diheme cytochrome c family protein
MFQIVTRGQKNMPSYAAQVPPEDRRAAISYVRSLQGGPRP